MATIEPQLYFAISNRVGDSTKLQGQSILSLQKVKPSHSLELEQAPIEDPATGRLVPNKTPLPALNYRTSVDFANGFAKEATVTITHLTRNGQVSKTFKLNRANPVATYIDENYVIKFGIDDFEIFNDNTTDEEFNQIIRRNVEKIKKLLDLKTANVLGDGSVNDVEPNL